MKPTELSTDIDTLYEQMQTLPEFEDDFCRNSFEGYLRKIQQIHGFHEVSRYRVVFIGKPGQGKTTAICNWLGLLREDKSKASKLDDVTLLATASGRTTVGEIHIRQVTGASCLRMEYLPEAEQKEYIREFCEYYYSHSHAQPAGGEEADDNGDGNLETHSEMDRVVRNMAGLERYPVNPNSDAARARQSKIRAWMGRFEDVDTFFEYVLQRVDLRSRKCRYIERPAGSSFEEWLSKTFKEINDGERLGCSIASKIFVDVSIDDRDLHLPEFVCEVIDTKGLDTRSAVRPDLQELLRSEDTVCFLMDDVTGVPSDSVCDLLKETFLTEWDRYYRYKTSIYVKATDVELTSVNGADGDPDLGKECKSGEIDRKVRTNNIPYEVENTIYLDSCAAYLFSTKKRPVLHNNRPVMDSNGKQKMTRVTVLTDYDDDIADEYRSDVSCSIITLIDRLRSKLEEDAASIGEEVRQLLVIENNYERSDAFRELDGVKKSLMSDEDKMVSRFPETEVRDEILEKAIVSIHWATIRKMNSLYGGYHMWHTDIYTQIAQAGRECFCSAVLSASECIRQQLLGVKSEEALSISKGLLHQYELMVKNSTETMGELFLRWALDEGFAPQSDENPFWVRVNSIYGRGYKRNVQDEYRDQIHDGVKLLTTVVTDEVRKDVDELLALFPEQWQ